MKIKAVGLLSGGLDSTLAARLILEQDIEVYAINFTSPFHASLLKKPAQGSLDSAVKQLGSLPLKRISLGDEFISVIKNPRHGHGKGMNPCIDCRILTLNRAFVYMREIGGSFIFTGEVLGQRPMSQHRRAISIIDNESGAAGYILRPLSARLLEPTIPEQKGWVDRDKLLAIKGRSRKEQIALAKAKGIYDYPNPAGGCLLTDPHFADRLRDYFAHTGTPDINDINLLTVGRHFRLENGEKIIVARNETECNALKFLCRGKDSLFMPNNFSGPTVLLQGEDKTAAIAMLVKYTHATIPCNGAICCMKGDKCEIIPKNDWNLTL